MQVFSRGIAALCLVWMFVSPPVFGSAAMEQLMLYRQQTGEEQVDYLWRLREQGELVTIRSSRPEKSFTTVCSPDGATFSWRVEMEGGDQVVARREGDKLVLQGEVDGERLHTTVTLDERPWMQPLSFGLRPLVTGEKRALHFWMVRPDNYTVVRLTAKRKSCGPQQGGSEEGAVCEVEVTKSGVLAPFWHASYWFRQKDGVFVRYQATHGLPGTPVTRIELIEEGQQKAGETLFPAD